MNVQMFRNLLTWRQRMSSQGFYQRYILNTMKSWIIGQKIMIYRDMYADRSKF